jgi:hypothetical protein
MVSVSSPVEVVDLMNGKFISSQDFAKMIGISNKYLTDQRSKGVLLKKPHPKYYRLSPRKCFYKIQDIEAWVKEYQIFKSIENGRSTKGDAA